MRWRPALLLGAVMLLFPVAAEAERPLSSSLLLERLADPVARLAPLPPGVRPVMVSSHDRSGGNVDGGSYGGAATAFGLTPTFVRHEDGGYVLYETERPGCLLRTFMATPGPPVGSAKPFGRLQVFIDGEREPGFDAPAADLFEGRLARYPKPLVGGYEDSSGGDFAYVPFCFSRSLKVRTTKVPPDGLGWWQLGLLLAPEGTPVEPFDPRADLSAAARALGRAGDPPPAAPDFSTGREAQLEGSGTIQYLRLSVRPFDIATLRDLSLRVTVNGAFAPQLDVPLANLFGDGIETRPIAASAFGMSPDRGTGYLALPIPYERGASIEVAGSPSASVRLEGWTGPPAPAGSGLLHGEHHVVHARRGLDTDILHARGSGREAAVVMDYLDGGPVSGVNPLQRFLEGDERVYVDGSRSPSMYGTGHEEFSNAGFYFYYGPFSLELGGAGPLGRLPSGAGTQSQYRVFGDEGPRWSSSIAHGHEHGGGDEQPATVGVTTYSYRDAATLERTAAVSLGGTRTLTAYFEGERDGNTTVSTVVAGGFYYPAPPPGSSPEAFTGTGIDFSRPLTATVRTDPGNEGLVLRGLFDQRPPFASLAVEIDGEPAGIWTHPSGVPTSWKRWLEDDFDVARSLTAGKASVRVTLTPARPGATANLFGLEALTRR